jgi:hypothetical protein
MLKEGRTSTVHFLTREAADEEKRILEERVEKAQAELRQKDVIIKDKDARITALNEQRTWQQPHTCIFVIDSSDIYSGDDASRPESRDCSHAVFAE